jgi:hypothetical protein
MFVFAACLPIHAFELLAERQWAIKRAMARQKVHETEDNTDPIN